MRSNIQVTLPTKRLQTIITLCNSVSNITKSLETSLPSLFWDALNAPQLGLSTTLNPDLKKEYASALKSCRQFKLQNCLSGNSVLSLSNIRKCVQMVNDEHQTQSKTLDTLIEVNTLLMEMFSKQNNPSQLKKHFKPLRELLSEPCLQLKEISELEDTEILVSLLTKKLSDRISASNPQPSDQEDETEACLWLEDIQDSVQEALLIVQNIKMFLASQTTLPEEDEEEEDDANKENIKSALKVKVGEKGKA
ncbi:hypothetical protein WDU94_000337 [Cyamophila willieti]